VIPIGIRDKIRGSFERFPRYSGGGEFFGAHANNFLSMGAGATVFGGIVGIGDLNKPARFEPNRTVNVEDIGGFVEKWGQKCAKRPPS
jgi:hypothetical protein